MKIRCRESKQIKRIVTQIKDHPEGRLTLFDMEGGGGGHDGPPKCVLTTVLKRVGVGS